jgi:hypothetical protein
MPWWAPIKRVRSNFMLHCHKNPFNVGTLCKIFEFAASLRGKAEFQLRDVHSWTKGPFNNSVDKMGVGGGQKMFVFVHAALRLLTKTVHPGGWVKKWQHSVQVVVE